MPRRVRKTDDHVPGSPPARVHEPSAGTVGRRHGGPDALNVGALDSPSVRLLLPVVSPGLVTEDGFLLFIEDGLVKARRLDLESWELSGDTDVVAEG
jgi:hypothetical protein